MGLMGLLMAHYGGLPEILSGLTKSTDHPSCGLGEFRVPPVWAFMAKLLGLRFLVLGVPLQAWNVMPTKALR